MTQFNNIDRIGINKVESIILSAFGWIPRTILQSDVGIDMEVEIVDNKKATGQLFVLQIKTGESYFDEEKGDCIIYRGDINHYNYWTNHSLPVFIVLCNPYTDIVIFEQIINENCELLSKGFKISIPKTNILDSSNIDKFSTIKNESSYNKRLQRLIIQKELINKVKEGRRIMIEIEDWCNKLGYGMSSKIFEIDENDDEIEISNSESNSIGYIEQLALIYPWSEFIVDDDFYYDDEYDSFMENYGIWDPEDKCYVGARENFRDVRPPANEIRPVNTGGGEINLYRLEFTLNEIGESFIHLDKYLDESIQLKLRLR
ncbi:DUF4365 domain-containing protein [Chryseobacterium sp. B21-037]|uniref:DUF4365 domain-containing protein n=1 Tax=Chryseobacterium sp. B21-037 TaxID=2926038 RepID=UPI002358BF5A|nr:DUF4365 domain-containing protein [Chryseobacterium sp. B21-037]MDC8104963.1 DUF4365 domain-containing protein [Chryseobacterium sp. B21-037]